MVDFSVQYKNNKLKRSLFSEYDQLMEEKVELYEKVFPAEDNEKMDKTLKNIDTVVDNLKEKILAEEVSADPFFDEELFKNLDVLHNFISNFIPNYPKYYDKQKINPKAFLDARDILMNEFPISMDEMLYTPQSKTGVIRQDKMNFENGYMIDFDGNVYNQDRKIIFNSDLTGQKVKYIDPLNNKAVTDTGIRVELPEDFIDEFFEDKDIILKENEIPENYKDPNKKTVNPKVFKEKVKEIRKRVELEPKTINEMQIVPDIYAVFKGYPITYEEKELIELPVEDVYLKDFFELRDKLNMVEEIKQYNTVEKELGICNFKDIPYARLSSLLLWGGGERGVKPLSNAPITDKDIIFLPNGTAKYTGTNATISISRNGCSRRSYKTGHVCMWTSSNQMGVKRSLIQYIYRFCASIGLFNANIPRLIGYKRIKIFGGLCIGGLLERALCAWQERISQRINDMFQCVPAPLDTDLTMSGFENATYPHGPTLKSMSDLDKLQSVRFGDRFVINAVPTTVTGLKKDACGVFIFDPNGKLTEAFPWSYKKIWRGKPFNPKDNNGVIQEFNNMFNNPIIQDTLMNTNSLGEDSISRKLISLLYAFIKKQVLLSKDDLKSSMMSIVEHSIYEALDKSTENISFYVYLKEYRPKRFKQIEERARRESNKKDGTSIDVQAEKQRVSEQYIRIFNTHFAPLIAEGILKLPGEDVKKAIYKEIEEREEGSASDVGSSKVQRTREKIRLRRMLSHYEYSYLGYNPQQYLCPFEEHLHLYDAMLFALKHIPTKQLLDIYDKNRSFMEQIDPEEAKKFKSAKTISDFLETSDEKEIFKGQIDGSMDYIYYDLYYDGHPEYAFEQCKRRIDYFINKRKVFS